MPLSLWCALCLTACKHHITGALRKLSKHKMWDKFLVKDPNIWG